MSAVAWGVVVALIVGVSNLALGGCALRLSLDNRRHARAEPARQVQRQLRDKLRDIVEAAGRDIADVERVLSLGNDVPEVPPTIATAYDQIEPIHSRLSDENAGSLFRLVGGQLFLLANNWKELTRVQNQTYEPDSKARRVSAAEVTLRKRIDETKLLLDARIAYLDAHDKGA